MTNPPLDIRHLDHIVVHDEDSQLEIIPESNPRFGQLTDHAIEEEIRKYQKHLQTLNLRDGGEKVMKIIEALQMEQACRKRKRDLQKQGAPELKLLAKATESHHDVNGGPDNPRFRSISERSSCKPSQRAKSLPKTGGIEIWSKGHLVHGYVFDEEAEFLNSSKGTRFSPLLNPEGCTMDGEKDNSRIYSGQQAGPSSSRQGLRSSLKQCNGYDRKCGQVDKDQNSNAEDSENFVSPSQKQSKHSHSNSGEALPEEISSARTGSTIKGQGRKRARQSGGGGGGGGESSDTVVELFSSEDEQEKGTRHTSADDILSTQRKVYGLRSTVASRMDRVKIAYPSRDDPEAVEVLYHDLHRLEPLEFLNDTIIDFYIKYIQRPEVLDVEHKNKFHFFNSFFYKKLSDVVGAQKKHGADLSKLRKWTKGTNIFEKDYLFVPIHDKWHWSLAIVCHPGSACEDSDSQRCILHLDSMSPGHSTNVVVKTLRIYLHAEWMHQTEQHGSVGESAKLPKEWFPHQKMQVPQQENESDCGLFLLHYIECFLKVAPLSFKRSDVVQGKLFGRTWFKPSVASGLRKKIRDLLEGFFEAEAIKSTVIAETIERSSSQLGQPGSQTQVNLHISRGCCCSIDRPCPHLTQHMGSNGLKTGEDLVASPTVICTGESRSSGLKRAMDGEFLCSLPSGEKDQVSSADSIEEVLPKHQVNCQNGKLMDPAICDLHLVVDLPIQEDRCLADMISPTD